MLHNLFPTPVFCYSLPEEKQDRQSYLNYLYDLKGKDKGKNRSNVNSWHSSNNIHLLKMKEFGKLKDFILESAKLSIDEMGYDKIKLSLIESWCIISPTGGYNKLHSHPGAFLSGSYYISNPSSPITFNDPRPVKSFNEPIGMTVPTAHNITSVSMNPKEGDLLIFPSWLEHSVSENKNKNDRVIISFNFCLINN